MFALQGEAASGRVIFVICAMGKSRPHSKGARFLAHDDAAPVAGHGGESRAGTMFDGAHSSSSSSCGLRNHRGLVSLSSMGVW